MGVSVTSAMTGGTALDAWQTGGAFARLVDNPSLMHALLWELPLPVEVFTPDGVVVFVNRALMEVNGVPDPAAIVGVYNVLSDPVVNADPRQRAAIRGAFGGGATTVLGSRVPVDDLVKRGVVKPKPFEAAVTDAYLFPVKDGQTVAFVVALLLYHTVYVGPPEVADAQEYITTHWQEPFDLDATAASVHVSARQLYRLFEQHTDTTPSGYYKRVKIARLEHALADRSLSVAQAFESCGVSARSYARAFKEATGMSPKAYRDILG